MNKAFFDWVAVQADPGQGSGERVTIAIAIRNRDDGAVVICPALPEKDLPEGALRATWRECQRDLGWLRRHLSEKWLDNARTPGEQCPDSALFLAAGGCSHAVTMEEAVKIACRLTASSLDWAEHVRIKEEVAMATGHLMGRIDLLRHLVTRGLRFRIEMKNVEERLTARGVPNVKRELAICLMRFEVPHWAAGQLSTYTPPIGQNQVLIPLMYKEIDFSWAGRIEKSGEFASGAILTFKSSETAGRIATVLEREFGADALERCYSKKILSAAWSEQNLQPDGLPANLAMGAITLAKKASKSLAPPNGAGRRFRVENGA
jgi:hypothetical protein